MDASLNINIDTISLSQSLMIALLMLTISVLVAMIHAFNTRAKALNQTTLLGIHVTAWQASAGMNILFWIGISGNPLMAVLLGIISLSMDIAKITIPRLQNITLTHRFAVLFFIAISIFATQNIGSQVSRQSEIEAQTNDLKNRKLAAQEDAAKSRIDEGYIDPKTKENLRKDRQNLSDLYRADAVNSKGDTVYKKGKKLDVMTATSRCNPSNVFSKIRQNQCESIKSLEKTILDTSDTLSDSSDNKQNLSRTLENAEKELNQTKAQLPINDLIAKLIILLGVDPETAHKIETISFVFGLIVAICLDLVINGTIPSQKSNAKKAWSRSLLFYFRLLKAARNARKSGDTLGAVWGYLDNKSVEKCRAQENVEFSTKSDPLEILRALDLQNVEEHINFNNAYLTFPLKSGHREAVVFLLTRKDSSGKSLLGEDASINQLYQETRERFGEGGGIKKDRISEAKQILFYNGIMKAEAYGKLGKVVYKYHDIDILPYKIRAVQNGRKIQPFYAPIIDEKATEITAQKSDSTAKKIPKSTQSNSDYCTDNVIAFDLFNQQPQGSLL